MADILEKDGSRKDLKWIVDVFQGLYLAEVLVRMDEQFEEYHLVFYNQNFLIQCAV